MSNQLGDAVKKEVNEALTAKRLSEPIAATIGLNKDLRDELDKKMSDVVAQSKDIDTRVSIATDQAIKNKSSDIERLVAEALAGDKGSELMKRVLSESQPVKERIIADSRHMVLDRSLLPVQRLNALTQLELYGKESLPQEVLWGLIEDPDSRLRQKALQALMPGGQNDGQSVDRILTALDKDADVAEKGARFPTAPRMAFYDPLVVGGELGSAYTECLSRFKESAIPSLDRWLHEHAQDVRCSLVAHALARIGGAKALDALCWLAENPSHTGSTTGTAWTALTILKAESLAALDRRRGVEFIWKKTKGAKDLPLVVAVDPTSPTAWPGSSTTYGLIRSISDTGVVVESDDDRSLHTTPKSNVHVSNPFVFQRVAIVRNINTPYSYNQSAAIRNLLSAGGREEWDIVREVMMGSGPGSKLEKLTSKEESALQLWLNVFVRPVLATNDPETQRLASKINEARAVVCSGMVELITDVDDCLRSQICRSALVAALSECSEDSLATFYHRFPSLVKHAAEPAGAAAKTEDSLIAGASMVLVAAVSRDDRRSTRLGLTHDLMRRCKSKGQTDWKLTAVVAGTLAGPILEDDDRSTNFLYDCLGASIASDPLGRTAAREALHTLRHTRREASPEAADRLLSWLTRVDIGKISESDLKPIRNELTSTLRVCCSKGNPKDVLPAVRDALGRLQKGSQPHDDPNGAFARGCLIEVLQTCNDVLAVPLLTEDLASTAAVSQQTRQALRHLATLIRGKIPALPESPSEKAANPPSLVAERDRWLEWWQKNDVEKKVRPLWNEFVGVEEKPEPDRKQP
jgi:hypothetical protein